MLIILLGCLCLYIFIKILLQFIIVKWGKISYDGFSSSGFRYHSKKDVFYSVQNAWQKNFGYTHIYDVMCPWFQMIVDVLPIHFYYNHKNWLISFWKGQYGITTGAEIGIYNTKEQKVSKNTLYMPIHEDEKLDMGFILYFKDQVLIKARERHWWLALFKLGFFSKPKDLTMALHITFPNEEMLHAFVEAFEKIGYKQNEYKTFETTFYFVFKKSKVRKVWTRSFIGDFIRQKINYHNVMLYQKLASDAVENNKKDDSMDVNAHHVFLYKFVPSIFENKDYHENR